MREISKSNEENKKKEGKRMNGLQIRWVTAAFIFLFILGLNQFEAGKDFLKIIKLEEIILSNEEIYRVEDRIILWYNDVIEDK